ncbi:MAG TPA: tetratricopeptide repeat protein [Longimicrobiales bacterium]
MAKSGHQQPDGPAAQRGFWRELRRRKVPRIAGAYLAGAFAVLQAGDILFDVLVLPRAVFRAVAALLILGFPATLVLAWMFDITPDGVRRARAPAGAARPPRGYFATLLAFGLAIALLGVWAFLRPGTRDRTTAPTAAIAAGPSIAVLPFEDFSPARDQEYFSDGLTEELLNVLAQVPGLRVAARTSSFAFKGKRIDAREIGRRLDVGTVLEGSVRKAGNTLRITAQLINVEDGFHLWSQHYDRELTDIFAIQDEIAGAIADALLPRLGAALADGPAGDRTPAAAARAAVPRLAGTASIEAHDAYLLGLYHWNRRSLADLRRAVELFEEALRLDPDYARAHAGIALALSVMPFLDVDASTEALTRGKAAGLRALELDPQLPEAYAALGQIATYLEHDWAAADRYYRRARELNPNYATAHQWYAELQALRGRLGEALQAAQIARELDPLSPVVNHVLGAVHLFRREFDDAERAYRRTLELDPTYFTANVMLWRIHIAQRRYDAALDALAATPFPGIAELMARAQAGIRGTGTRESALDAVRAIERLDTGFPMLAYVPYLLLGDVGAAFRSLEEAYRANNPQVTYFWLDPLFDDLREDPVYVSLVRRLGLEEALRPPVM